MVRSSDKKKTSPSSSTEKTTAPSSRFSRTRKNSARKPRRLAGPIRLIKQTIEFIRHHKWMWFGILFFYAVLQILLVQGVLGGDIREFGETFRLIYDDVSSGEFRLAILTYVLTSTGQANTESGAVFQAIGTIIVSLALIWGVRQAMANKEVGIRDAYYRGMYPLIPFVLVLLVVLLQLIPLAIGAWLYQTLVIAGIAVTLIEQIFWIGIAAALAFLTIYMLCSSFFALYIATLPDVKPMQALRSARGLVKFRRAAILFRVIVVAFALFVVSAVLLVPIVFVVPVAATWLFFLLGIISFGFYLTYMYGLYRELLDESK